MGSVSRSFAFVAAACLVAGLSSCGANPSHTQEQNSPSGTAERTSPSVDLPSPPAEIPNWPPRVAHTSTIARKLESPWSVVEVLGSYLVSTRDSGEIIQVLPDGTKRVAASVDEHFAQGEGGLLGLAYDAEFGLYAYVSTSLSNRVIRFDVLADGDDIVLSEPATIIPDIPRGETHNGGRLAFGPDRKLYVATGGAGIANGAAAQDLDSAAGKILRMEPDGALPEGNPYEDSYVWSLGHRNIQGLAWSQDGVMFASEFGAQTWDELNVIEAGGNYGWPEVEGIAGVDGYIDPVQQWPTEEASPSGMTVRDDVIYIANLQGESLRAVPIAAPNVSEVLLQDVGRVRDVVVTQNHSLLVLTSNTDGRGKSGKDDDLLIELSIEVP